MRFYTKQPRFYAGVDLHALTMYVCILDYDGGDPVAPQPHGPTRALSRGHPTLQRANPEGMKYKKRRRATMPRSSRSARVIPDRDPP